MKPGGGARGGSRGRERLVGGEKVFLDLCRAYERNLYFSG